MPLRVETVWDVLSAGTDLDGWIQRTVKRVSDELDRPSSCRLQAFSLLIWVRIAAHPSVRAAPLMIR